MRRQKRPFLGQTLFSGDLVRRFAGIVLPRVVITPHDIFGRNSDFHERWVRKFGGPRMRYAVRATVIATVLAIAGMPDLSPAQPASTNQKPIRGGPVSAQKNSSSVAFPQMSTEPATLPSSVTGCASTDLSCLKLFALSLQVEGLKSQLTQIQNQLAPILGRANVSCSGQSISRNGLGVSENCAPYICTNETGLCRETCRSVSDCSTGNACAPNFRCVPLPSH